MPEAPPLKHIECDLMPAFGFKRLHLTLSVPTLPRGVRDARFAEHRFDRMTGVATNSVMAIAAGGVVASDDLGQSWEFHPIPHLDDLRLRNAFTCDDGGRLLQTAEPLDSRDRVTVIRCDHSWNVTHVNQVGAAPWHGSRSIDQAGDVILYAEYPYNGARYSGVTKSNEPAVRSSCVYGSRDGGRSWSCVFRVDVSEIRHFHTLAADPYAPRMWWLSSGDRAQESRVWRSVDDGLTWQDVTGRDVQVELHPTLGKDQWQRAYRYTDLVVLPDHLIWGCDDWLGDRSRGLSVQTGGNDGNRAGSKLFVTSKEIPLAPREFGYVGNPVRSITDVGAGYLVTTEGKHPDILPGPQVVLISKSEPFAVQPLPALGEALSRGTSFSASIASRAHKNGRFFTQRGALDVFRGGPRILQWDIDFN